MDDQSAQSYKISEIKNCTIDSHNMKEKLAPIPSVRIDN